MNTLTLEEQIGQLLRAKGWTLALAESCTGGLLGHRITNIPGSSDYFLGGVVAYAYEAKVKLLGVKWETLQQHGAVSRETVLEMAHGARERLGANIALSISGIAGPTGGTPEKPVGTTWIGLVTPDLAQAYRFHFKGDRNENKKQATEEALRLLLEYLTSSSPAP
ncbi:MAG: CinA family protein [Anaerolineales bacterium]